MNNETAYYPLAIGNTWIHNFGGDKMITIIESCNDAGEFTVSNSLNPVKGIMKKINGEYFTDGMTGRQSVLKDDLKLGETWKNKFKAPSGLDTVYVYTVKEILPSKTVGGKEYNDVVMIELDSKYVINDVETSMNAFTQNYYARGVGMILTTTSGVIGNTETPLLSYELK
jgi:hypothetical protein